MNGGAGIRECLEQAIEYGGNVDKALCPAVVATVLIDRTVPVHLGQVEVLCDYHGLCLPEHEFRVNVSETRDSKASM